MLDLESPPVDGNRLLMVAQELMMALFSLLYAYPHIPSRIIDDRRSTTWFSIGSKEALRLGITNLLQTSPVIAASLAPGVALTDITWRTACDPDELDAKLLLQLYHDDVPMACQQMYHAIAAVYTAVTNNRDIPTRESMQFLLQQYQVLPTNFKLPSDRSDRTGLLRFCSEQTVAWVQPYFACHPLFFDPTGLAGVCR